jgi:hypothetical protein
MTLFGGLKVAALDQVPGGAWLVLGAQSPTSEPNETRTETRARNAAPG